MTPDLPTPSPTLAHIPERGGTPERMARFLDRLAAHGNVRAACRAVLLSAEAAYRLRRRDALFADGWAAALVLARQNGEQVLGERAIEGIEEEIYRRGELVGTRRRFDAGLLLAHLARLDRLADEEAAGVDAGNFDELLLAIVGEEDLRPATDRAAFVAAAGSKVAKAHEREQTDAHLNALEEPDAGVPDEADAASDADTYHDFRADLAEECAQLAAQARMEAAEQ